MQEAKRGTRASATLKYQAYAQVTTEMKVEIGISKVKLISPKLAGKPTRHVGLNGTNILLLEH